MSTMAETDETILTTPRKFKLRRIKSSPPEEVIEQNLLPLKENIRRKQFAQRAYYENHGESGISPLTRNFTKPPVHLRLGRRVPFTGTNTSAIPPKRRLHRVGPFGNQGNVRRNRIFSAQHRINRIRAQQREMLNNQNYNMSKKIKLRRTLPQRIGGPTNLQVQVKNNRAFVNMQTVQNIRRFKQILNYQLQQEIKKIQMELKGKSQEILPFRVTPVGTAVSLHMRFAALC
ncbi:hypothetical protein NQ317_003780 [Molorchus minor]|uniref:UAP56-interacting factor n=1 Tax=Molorchus minor TaxID=1323400 RepID=A0ABQ9JTR2_9CUCU|nr:hypothetical protein NQ317_003780 [Molorchus minor]